MNITTLLSKLSDKRNGQWFKIEWMTEVPLTARAKKNNQVVLKYTHSTMRKGISYKNIKRVQLKKLQENKENDFEKLPWGNWNPTFPGLLIEHKDKTYVRLYTTPNKPKVTYYLNGRPIDVEKLKSLNIVPSGYFNKTEPADCITINVDNIQDIY